MKVIAGLEQHPRVAAGIQRRIAMRRLVAGARHPGTHHRLEDLASLSDATVLRFQPSLRPDVTLTGSRLLREPFEMELDEFERALVVHSNGQFSLEEVMVLAVNDLDGGGPDEPVVRAAEFFSELARYDMLLTGVQEA